MTWVRIQNGGAYEASYSIQWNGGETDRTRVVPSQAPGGSMMTASIDLGAYANVGSPCWARMYVVAGPNKDSGSFPFPIDPPGPFQTVIGYTSEGGAQTPDWSDWYWTD